MNFLFFVYGRCCDWGGGVGGCCGGSGEGVIFNFGIFFSTFSHNLKVVEDDFFLLFALFGGVRMARRYASRRVIPVDRPPSGRHASPENPIGAPR